MASADTPTGWPVASREDAVTWAKRAARRDFELLRLLSKRPMLLRAAVSAGMLGACNCAYKGGGACAQHGAVESRGAALEGSHRWQCKAQRRQRSRRQGARPEERPAAAAKAVAPVAATAERRAEGQPSPPVEGRVEQPPSPRKRRRRAKSEARKAKDAAKLEAKWRARRELCAHRADGEAAAEVAMEVDRGEARRPEAVGGVGAEKASEQLGTAEQLGEQRGPEEFVAMRPLRPGEIPVFRFGG